MNNKNKEIEVRFLIKDLQKFSETLQRVGAVCVRNRYLEINELFDTLTNDLKNNFETLRLRSDWTHKITYKRALTFNIRKEIEFEVFDIKSAREMFRALGYERFLLFEKYRSIYDWQGSQITIDETPLGLFVEIEDQSLDILEEKSIFLQLSWDAQVRKSYYELFSSIQNIGGGFQELTFESFGGWMPSSIELDLEYAD